jgi:hypothetical protein
MRNRRFASGCGACTIEQTLLSRNPGPVDKDQSARPAIVVW